MKLPTTLLFEVRGLVDAIREEGEAEDAGPIVVSGMLFEQLARELGAGARPGAVVVDEAGSPAARAEVLVHVMAGAPSRADEALVRTADRAGVPVVLVQLWPQERWTPPFVLTPFVVECRAGEGFPVEEIARRIADAAEHWTELARRVPALHDVVADKLVGASVVRSALAGALARRGEGSRSLLALEQVRVAARLQSLQDGARADERPQVVAGAAVAAVALSFALRDAARRAREFVPAPVANAAIAAATTWAVATAARRFSLSTR